MVDEQTITFLCPNGHKLSGPASLQGRPGQCPHCNSQFVIPDYSVPTQTEDVPAVGEESEVFSGGDIALEPSEDLSAADEIESFSVEDTTIAKVPPASLEPHLPADLTDAATAAGGSVSLQHAFELLWARRSAGVTLELHLKSGDMLCPEFYSTSQSGPSQGLFATRDDDGSYALSAVAWDAVAQITLRGVLLLPDDLFAS